MMDDLEFLREMFKDTRLHIGIGTIKKLGLALDSSVLRVIVNLLPENRQIVATMGWTDSGASTGIINYPEVDDLVIVAFVDGHPDEAFVIKQISTSDEKIPSYAQSGHMVIYSRPGKKVYLGSDTKIGLARPNHEPSSALVLGDVLVNGLTALCNAFLNASQVGQSAMGPVWLDPSVRTALTNFINTYLTTTSTNILSQIGFTERGV